MTKMKMKTPNLPFSHLPDAAGRQVRVFSTQRRNGSRAAELFGSRAGYRRRRTSPIPYLLSAREARCVGWALARDHGSRSASGRIAGAIPGKALRVRPRTSSRRTGRALPAPSAPPLASRTRKPRFAGTRKFTEFSASVQRPLRRPKRRCRRVWPHLRSFAPVSVVARQRQCGT